MRNEAPSRSLVRRANQVKTLALLVGAIGVFVTAIGVLGAALPLVYVTDPSYNAYVFGYNLALVVGVGLLVVALALAIRAFTWKTDNDLALITGRALAQYFDDRFTLIRNVSKREIGYVDAVLLGPPGVLVFRILDATGDFANEGVNWLTVKPNNETVPASIHPSVEAIADIRKVREYLENRHLPNIPVFGVVVFTKPPNVVRISARDPVVPPSLLQDLFHNLQPNYLAKDRIDQPTVEQIRHLLLGE